MTVPGLGHCISWDARDATPFIMEWANAKAALYADNPV